MDDLERRIRDANPSSVRPGDPLSARALRDLDRIKRIAEPPRRRRTSTWIGAGTIAATLALIAAAVGFGIFSSDHRSAVYAATPQLLQASPLPESADILLGEFSMNARNRTAQHPANHVTYQTWAVQLHVDEGVPPQPFVQPQVVTSCWEPDLSGSFTIVAGDPYAPAGAEAVDTTRAKPPGTVIVNDSYGPGEFPLVFRDEPPSDGAAMRTYLLEAVGMSGSTDAIDLLRAVQAFLSQRVPTAQQEAAILDALRDSDGLNVYGRVTDRLGREGIAFSAEGPGPVRLEHLLIVEPSSGEIIAAETIYHGGDPTIALPIPAVLEYLVWKRN